MPDTSQAREQRGELNEAIGKAFLDPAYGKELMEKCGVESLQELAIFFMKDSDKAKEILSEEALDKDNQSMSG